MDLYTEVKQNQKNVSAAKMMKLLESFGFEHRRTTGDHYMFKRKGYRTIPIPYRQNPLALRIVKNILNVIDEIIENE